MILIIGGFAQGKNEFTKENFPQKSVWKDFHLFVKNALENGKSLSEIQAEVDSKIAESPEQIIICNELGCGIVPMEKMDEMWRETTGRILCKLAEQADSVYRVTCGIGVKIK